MRLIVLNDNAAGNNCGAEHGLSFLVEDEQKILFDTGPSDIFLKNAKILGVDINDANLIVLSHGHYDHGNGLEFIRSKKLVCHPECFVRRYRKADGSYIGLPLTLEEAKKNFTLVLAKEPYEISENIIFLGKYLGRTILKQRKHYSIRKAKRMIS